MLYWTFALAVVIIVLGARFFGIGTESTGVMNLLFFVGRVVTFTGLLLGRRAALD